MLLVGLEWVRFPVVSWWQVEFDSQDSINQSPLVRGFLIPRRGNTMKLKLATLLLSLTFCMSVFAYGNSQKPQTQDQAQSQGQSQGQNQGQAQQANAAAIAAAAASNKTVVDLTSVNVVKTDIDNTNVNVAKGGDGGNARAQGGDAYSGSKSKAHTGDNTNNIQFGNTLEAANTAMAAIASGCVDSVGMQGMNAGISISGATAQCINRELSSFHLAQAQVYMGMYNEGCKACLGFSEKSIEMAQTAAGRATYNSLETGASKTKSFFADVVQTLGWIAIPVVLL